MIFCKCSFDALDPIHQVEFVEVERDIVVTANYPNSGDADNTVTNIAT
jgi:hypothetical protein